MLCFLENLLDRRLSAYLPFYMDLAGNMGD